MYLLKYFIKTTIVLNLLGGNMKDSLICYNLLYGFFPLLNYPDCFKLHFKKKSGMYTTE